MAKVSVFAGAFFFLLCLPQFHGKFQPRLLQFEQVVNKNRILLWKGLGNNTGHRFYLHIRHAAFKDTISHIRYLLCSVLGDPHFPIHADQKFRHAKLSEDYFTVFLFHLRISPAFPLYAWGYTHGILPRKSPFTLA